MSVTVASRQGRMRAPVERLRKLAARTLSAVGRPDGEVHVTLVDDAEIRRLNRRYLGVRRSTDVLAFDLGLGGAARRPSGPPTAGEEGVRWPARSRGRAGARRASGPPAFLGEVVISAETAARQAERVGVSTALELDLLLVHGLLHLVGYDDHDPGEAVRMHERARQILSAGRRRPLPGRLWTGLLSQ